MKVHFDEIFECNADGSYSPRCMIKIKNTKFAPYALFLPGEITEGVDISVYIDQEIEGSKDTEGILSID